MDDAPKRSRFAAPLAALGVVTWAVAVFAHAKVGGLFAKLFEYGRAHPDFHAEKLIFGVIGGIGIAFVGALTVRLARTPRRSLVETLLVVLVWALAAAAGKRYLLYLNSELVHFVQYGLISLLLSSFFGPRAAFLLGSMGGLLDEVHQYVVYHGAGDDPDSYLDWNDVILNIVGSAGGALPSLALRRAAVAESEAEGKAPEPRPLALAVAIVGLLVLVVLPAAARVDLGHYPIDFWREYNDNHKPHHVLSPAAGLPAIAGLLLLFLYLLDERLRGVPTAGVASFFLLGHLALTPLNTEGPLPPPDGNVPSLVVPLTTTTIKVDGVLDEPVWQNAARFTLQDAVDPAVRKRWAEAGRTQPTQKTTGRVLWSAQALHVAFEVEDDDAWACDVPRDTTSLPGDEVVELFLDVDGAGTTYYELEVSPKNVVYDLLVQRPTPPAWRPVPSGFVGHEGWDWRGLVTAVKVDGELSVVDQSTRESYAPAPGTTPTTKGWVAELTLPFAALKGRRIPPAPGDRWRVNFNRVDRPRPMSNEDVSYPVLTSWAPLGRRDVTGFVSFHRPWRFGFLELSKTSADR